jgi:hypothetical protein
MNDALHDASLVFCERQLIGAIGDAESSVRDITTQFLAVRRRMLELMPQLGEAGKQAVELNGAIDRVVAGLQFFDEHAQRVRHVVQVLDLLIEDHARLPHAAVPEQWRPTLERMRAFLSTESEWRIFAGMFPGEDAGHHPGDEVELF